MFKFTTTTIINTATDGDTGLSRFVINTTDASTTSGTGAITSDNINPGELLIKRVGKFSKKDVLSIIKTVPQIEKVPTAKIASIATPTEGDIYRVALYLGLTDSQSSQYANDFVLKGKPLFIEAVAPDATATGLVNEIIKNGTAFITTVFEKELVKLSLSGSDLAISGISGHQVFRKVELQHWIPDPTNSTTGMWKVEKATKDCNVVQGNPGFGTYSNLIHNVILPTMENTRFGSPAASEVPIVGATYFQYIIRMGVDRGIMGGDAVGETTTSVTEHVFWVNSTLQANFEKLVTLLGTVSTQDFNPATVEAVPVNKVEKLAAKVEKEHPGK